MSLSFVTERHNILNLYELKKKLNICNKHLDNELVSMESCLGESFNKGKKKYMVLYCPFQLVKG